MQIHSETVRDRAFKFIMILCIYEIYDGALILHSSANF